MEEIKDSSGMTKKEGKRLLAEMLAKGLVKSGMKEALIVEGEQKPTFVLFKTKKNKVKNFVQIFDGTENLDSIGEE